MTFIRHRWAHGRLQQYGLRVRDSAEVFAAEDKKLMKNSRDPQHPHLPITENDSVYGPDEDIFHGKVKVGLPLKKH